MKWDYSTDPPTAWKIEDGDGVKISPEDIKKMLGMREMVCDRLL